MTRLQFPLFFLCLLVSISSFAELSVSVWKPAGSLAKVIIPLFSDQTSTDLERSTLQNYLEALLDSSDYTNAVNFIKPHQVENLAGFVASNPNFENFSQTSRSEKNLPIAIQANRTGQLFGSDQRRESMLASHIEAGADPYLIPVALDLIYTPQQLDEWNRWIARNFKALVLLGGADLDPKLYQKTNTSSVNTSIRRDRVEMKTVSTYLEYSQGIVIGYCRGAQLLAVLKGNPLIQDITQNDAMTNRLTPVIHRIESGAEHRVESAWHPIRLVTPSSIMSAFTPLSFEVNSRHHQGELELSTESGLVVTARAYDGIVEAFESLDGRIFGFQFHPEEMQTDFSRSLLKKLIQKAQTHPCLQLLM